MKVVLLAAGYGTRLGSLTKNKPKPLIKLGDKPLIGHLIDRLNQHGLKQIIVKVHYLPEQIIDYLGGRVLYYQQPSLLGHDETLFALKDWVGDESFMVINADTWTNVNYTEMIAKHIKGTITVCMDEWRCTGTWIYSPEFFIDKSIEVVPYRPANLKWFDIGTHKRLKEARKYFE